MTRQTRILAGLLIFLLFSSAPILGPTRARSQTKSNRVNFGYTGLGGVMIPVWVTREGGYLEKNGLKPEMLYIASSSKAIQAMLAGDLDFITSNSSSVVQADLGGADLVIVAGQINRMVNSIISLPDVKKVADLKGKSIGITRFGSYTDFEARYVLSQNGLKPDQDAAILQMGGQMEIFGGLLARRIHAGVLAPPFLQLALEKGMTELLDIRKVSPQYPANVITTRRKFLESSYDTAGKVVRAYVEGLYRTRTDKEFTMKVIAKYTREKNPKILSETYDYYGKDLFERVPYVTDEGMKIVFEQMADKIPPNRNVKPSDFVDMRILREIDRSGFVNRLYGPK